ncbi:hypothetical protein MICRO11B_230140 [Micrococcus luteus]|nr:hypothetical protein MICRO11B_230140 [Micrococcus luteus]
MCGCSPRPTAAPPSSPGSAWSRSRRGSEGPELSAVRPARPADRAAVLVCAGSQTENAVSSNVVRVRALVCAGEQTRSRPVIRPSAAVPGA